jgi:hypothetical protein
VPAMTASRVEEVQGEEMKRFRGESEGIEWLTSGAPVFDSTAGRGGVGHGTYLLP